MKTIVNMKFGSHLYGTSTQTSDTDYKGVFMPDALDVILGKIPKCITRNTKSDTSKKNDASDVDAQFYSLHYFLELACQGETVALDMLHAPDEMLLDTSAVWSLIRGHRSKFYTRNLKSFVGYARTQAAKYGVKGSRLSDCKRALDCLQAHTWVGDALDEIWGLLPTGEHISKDESHKVKLYTVCGRSIQSTCKIQKGIEILSKYYDNYGARAKLAENNEGIDWKAISHALRAAFQVREILTTGDLRFPLAEAPYLKLVKQGILSYKNEVGPRLEREMEELEEISKKSQLPERVDRVFWDSFLVDCVLPELKKS